MGVRYQLTVNLENIYSICGKCSFFMILHASMIMWLDNRNIAHSIFFKVNVAYPTHTATVFVYLDVTIHGQKFETRDIAQAHTQ